MKSSLHRPPILAWGLALLIAACVMLLSTSGAQAAARRGAVLVKDIHPGHAGSNSFTSRGGYVGGQLTNVSGTLYFSADDGRHGQELWRSDGTVRGTRMVKDINPGPRSGYFSGITPVGRTLYFSADDGVHGVELWRSDGTRAGTRMVKDLNPGSAFYNGVGWLIGVNGTLYFDVNEGSRYPSEVGLWRSDGTEVGTTLVKAIHSFGSPADVNGTLYFAGGGTDATGFHSGLWRSDGTPAGTTNVDDSPDLGLLHDLTNVNGTLYFISDTIPHGSGTAVDRELWRSDGTEAGTTMVKNFGTSPPGDLTDVNGTLYFVAPDGVYNALWRSDGTEAGTTVVTDLDIASDLTAVKGIIYFSAGGGLWRSDGTPQGTILVKGGLKPQSLTAAKGTLYFVGTDKRHGQELWRSDGTRKGTRMVRNIRPGSASSQPLFLTNVNGTLYFTAKDGRHGRELWRAGPRPCRTAKGKCKKG